MATVYLGNLRDAVTGQVFLGDLSQTIVWNIEASGDLAAGAAGFEAVVTRQGTIYDIGYVDIRSGAAGMEVTGDFTRRLVVTGDLTSFAGSIDGVSKSTSHGGGDLFNSDDYLLPRLDATVMLTTNLPIVVDLEAGAASLSAVAKHVREASGSLIADTDAQVDLSFQYYGRWAETAGASVVWTPVTSQVA